MIKFIFWVLNGCEALLIWLWVPSVALFLEYVHNYIRLPVL